MSRMLKIPTDIEVIELKSHRDNRGDWTRIFDTEILNQSTHLSQISISVNPKEGTLRGMHFQTNMHAEFKLVHCIAGAIFDVVVDIRPESQNYLNWYGSVLSAKEPKTLGIGPGYAHGFISLTPNTKLIYAMDKPFSPNDYKVLRWDDPKISIKWPMEPKCISDKDRNADLL